MLQIKRPTWGFFPPCLCLLGDTEIYTFFSPYLFGKNKQTSTTDDKVKFTDEPLALESNNYVHFDHTFKKKNWSKVAHTKVFCRKVTLVGYWKVSVFHGRSQQWKQGTQRKAQRERKTQLELLLLLVPYVSNVIIGVLQQRTAY